MILSRRSSRSIDYYGAAILVVLGAAVTWVGSGYEVGTLNQMGSGFMPVVYGVLLVLVGLAIAATASSKPAAAAAPAGEEHADDGHAPGPFELRGWGCILGGVVAFVALGEHGGFVPATFAAVFISALGDRDNTPAGAALLAAGVTVFGTLVFHYGLGIQLPLFAWG